MIIQYFNNALITDNNNLIQLFNHHFQLLQAFIGLLSNKTVKKTSFAIFGEMLTIFYNEPYIIMAKTQAFYIHILQPDIVQGHAPGTWICAYQNTFSL